MSNITPGFIWDLLRGQTSESVGLWRFDEKIPPCAPSLSGAVEDNPSVAQFARQGRTPIITRNKRTDSARYDPPKVIPLQFPLGVDYRFGQFLQYKRVFAVPVVVDVPIFSPVEPERCYTPEDNDSEYCKVYYGMQRWWKDGSVAIYVNGALQVSGYTLDLTEGRVTFDVVQARDAVVKASYVYSAPFIITSMKWNFATKCIPAMISPEIILREVAEIPT